MHVDQFVLSIKVPFNDEIIKDVTEHIKLVLSSEEVYKRLTCYKQLSYEDKLVVLTCHLCQKTMILKCDG